MPPVNDDFANATGLGSAASGEVTFDITGATAETGEHVGADGHTVWFTWTAPGDGTVSFDTADTPAPRWDSWLGAYVGGFGIGNWIAHDDDGLLQPGVTTSDGFGTSQMTLPVTSGTTYYIQVDSYDYAAAGADPSAGYPRSNCKLRWAWSPPAPPDPSISSVSPVQGIAGTVVDLHGSNLDTINHVRFGSADASFTVIDPSHVQAIVPVTHVGSSTVSVVTDTALNPVSTLAFTVLFPGRWIALGERFGNQVSPGGSWRYSGRDWPLTGYVPPADITGPPDNSVATSVLTGTAQASVTVSAGGTTPPSSPGDVQVRQSVALVDVQSVWDNDPGGFDFPLYGAMDPHPTADIPALPTDAVTYEWRHPTVTTGTIADGAVVFGGRYRFHVETTSPGRSTAETSSLHVDLRRVPAGSYTEEPIGSATPLVGGWFFPSALAAMASLATYPVTTFTGSGPVEATTYDLAESDLDTGRLHALVVTHTEYIAGSSYSAADSTNNGVFVVRIAFLYTPDQYRFLYTKPQTTPPLRQYPRDDALGGTPRQGRHSRSVQASTREGWAGTYR